jgi:D-alanyl-D-alanine carboxypeptidase-like protein
MITGQTTMPNQDIFGKYPFLNDASLSDDLKRFLIEKSLQSETAAWTNQLERRKWWWSTPVAIALTGLITIAANFGVSYWTAAQKQHLDDQTGDSDAKRKAAAAEREFQYRIVERELTQDKPEKDRARVLLFLVRSGVLNGLNATELRQMAEDTLNDKAGASIPSLGALRQNMDARRIVCNIPYRAASQTLAEISPDWLANNLTEVVVPQLSALVKDGKVRFNNIASSALKAAFAEIETANLMGRVLSWDGSFVPRLTGSLDGRLSVHACGIAFDINSKWNPFGSEPAAAGKEGSVVDLVPIFEKHGFEWAGRRSPSLREGAHFEFVISSQP